MFWIHHLLTNLSAEIPEFKYHGVDVVESVISKSVIKFKEMAPRWKMTKMDISKDPLPTGYDLVFSRDALQHLPLNLVADALKNIALTSNAKYLLVGSYFEENRNDRYRRLFSY